jgi:hypothetical protein
MQLDEMRASLAGTSNFSTAWIVAWLSGDSGGYVSSYFNGARQ